MKSPVPGRSGIDRYLSLNECTLKVPFFMKSAVSDLSFNFLCLKMRPEYIGGVAGIGDCSFHRGLRVKTNY